MTPYIELNWALPVEGSIVRHQDGHVHDSQKDNAVPHFAESTVVQYHAAGLLQRLDRILNLEMDQGRFLKVNYCLCLFRTRIVKTRWYSPLRVDVFQL